MSGYTERATTRRRQAGFTLIEVMVAIMLMAIVSLMAWRGLDSIARASAHLEDSTEQGAALLRALTGAQPGAPLQRVRWWRQGKILYRAASPSGDRLPLPPLAERVAVLDDVSRFEIRAWVPGKGWTRLPARSKVRASGLEISLSRVTRNGVERYRRVVALQ